MKWKRKPKVKCDLLGTSWLSKRTHTRVTLTKAYVVDVEGTNVLRYEVLGNSPLTKEEIKEQYYQILCEVEQS